ncbi:Hypothetical predicted protein [Paramuricea clavata]|uniref:Uncharacterized protein n=1 Tax=Paramuricea clavata TaxID=317549 RepID=A0A6S7JJS5_PARCT|nr:Hypothetical predicted protein [Paramuricea clavata]
MDQPSEFCAPGNGLMNGSLCERNSIPARITSRYSLSGCLSYGNIRKRTSNPCNLVNVPVTTSNLKNHRNNCAVPSFFVTNACHIANKVDELSAVVAINNSSVILVTDSWLSSDIPDSIINIGNTYNSYRLDRHTPGGGILA